MNQETAFNTARALLPKAIADFFTDPLTEEEVVELIVAVQKYIDTRPLYGRSSGALAHMRERRDILRAFSERYARNVTFTGG